MIVSKIAATADREEVHHGESLNSTELCDTKIRQRWQHQQQHSQLD